ncbi:hypothetical protein [Nitratireductor basaltis]|uniref:Uncharacterized protein n=1 Tax=Nitratireductor basaltis TaxID=472175 RepID=A0A084U9W8_9HYPH|nr:hypothetical protein [Nitratireductor basaltis]KFB09754.1 hypothetical protein EL18_00773 [Nitratireductor basaltis]
MSSPKPELSLYRLIPDAPATDPNWDLAPSQGIVTVCAYSPADARIVAAEAELDFLDIAAKPGDGTSTKMASAFRDEKLYRVEEIEQGTSGERGVVQHIPQEDLIRGKG